MTAASGNPGGKEPRRQRFARRPAPVTLTPQKVALLRQIADYGLATVVQLAKLVGPSEKSVRRHLRELYDSGLTDLIAIPRAALAAPGEVNDARLLYGSAPNIACLKRAGQKALIAAGYPDTPAPLPPYGPRNWAFVAHALAIRDVRLWLELSARYVSGQTLETWKCGGAAAIDLERVRAPQKLYPDAWFTYRVGEQILVGLLEVDRGTERGNTRWQEKLTGYHALFESGRLAAVTGYRNARIIVVTSSERRRDSLATFIQQHADPTLASRFWCAGETLIATPGLDTVGWRQPGQQMLRALLK